MLEAVRGWLKAGNRTSAKTVSLISNWLTNVLWLIESRYLSLAQKAVGQNSIVYSAVRFLSQAILEPPLEAYRQTSPEKRSELPLDHPLVQLIRSPNECMTEVELWEMLTIQLAITGRSVWLKERSNRGEPVALWPLRPDRVAPIYSISDKQGERVLRGWSYQVPGTGQYVEIPRADSLFVNLCDPAGESGGIVEGLGPISALAREIASDNEATSYVGSLLANHAAPTVAIKVKAAIRNETDAQLIKQRFRAEFGGARRGTPALLDGDSTLEMLSFNMRELEFPDLRSIAESRICAALGVPPVLVGLKVGLEHSTFSNMEEARKFFTEVTCQAYWRRFADAFQTQLCPEFGPDIVVEFDLSKVAALASRRNEQLQPIVAAFSSGIVTRNEYRQALNLPLLPPELGDVLQMPSSVTEVPVSDAARKKAEAASQAALPQPEEQEQLPAPEEKQKQLPSPEEEQSPALQAPEEKRKAEAMKAVAEAERLLGINKLVWLGFKLDPVSAKQLAVPGGEPPDNLHLTLCMLKPPSPEQLEFLPTIVAKFASQAGPQRGSITGVGRFQAEDVVYASVSGAELQEFRAALVEELEAAGFTVDRTYGFTPHTTLGPAALPVQAVPLLVLTFQMLWLGEQPFPLSGAGIPPSPEEEPAVKFALVARGEDPVHGQPLVSDRRSAVRLASRLGAEAVEVRGVTAMELPDVDLVLAKRGRKRASA